MSVVSAVSADHSDLPLGADAPLMPLKAGAGAENQRIRQKTDSGHRSRVSARRHSSQLHHQLTSERTHSNEGVAGGGAESRGVQGERVVEREAGQCSERAGVEAMQLPAPAAQHSTAVHHRVEVESSHGQVVL